MKLATHTRWFMIAHLSSEEYIVVDSDRFSAMASLGFGVREHGSRRPRRRDQDTAEVEQV